MKPLHSIAVALQRLVRRLPIWCEHEGCKRLRARGCYGFCRPCWAYGVKITWEALGNDDPAPPNASVSDGSAPFAPRPGSELGGVS